MLGLNLGLWSPIYGVSYSAEASALFARMSTPPSAARKSAINSLIVSLKSAGVWSKLSCLQVYAAADSQAALLNWVSTSYNATLTGTPTFTADRQIQTNGSSHYISTGWAPSNGSQNSVSFGFWSNRGLGNVTYSEVGSWKTAPNTGASLGFYDSSGTPNITLQLLLNSAYDTSNWQTAGGQAYYAHGLLAGSRLSSTEQRIYAQGSLVATNTSYTSASPSTYAVPLGALSLNGSIIASHSGGWPYSVFFATSSALSDGEMSSLNSALVSYMKAVGNWSTPLVGWGDSLSNGTWEQYAAQRSITTAYPFRRTVSKGVSGETSTQIATRMLADSTYNDHVQVIWCGRNDINNAAQTVPSSTIKSNVASMVAAAQARSQKYLVIGVTTRNKATGSIYSNSEDAGTAINVAVQSLNSDLSALYGSNFLDILNLLVAKGFTGDANDQADAALYVPPRSCMSDDIHFNATGYTFIGQKIEDKLETLSY